MGCSADDLADLERQEGIRLPASYREYASAAGMRPGDFLVGSDLAFDQLDTVRRSALALLEDDSGPKLPDAAFVFCSHQGYQFLFFELGDSPDPPVFHYLEGTRAFREVAPSFSAWLGEAVLADLSVV